MLSGKTKKAGEAKSAGRNEAEKVGVGEKWACLIVSCSSPAVAPLLQLIYNPGKNLVNLVICGSGWCSNPQLIPGWLQV